MSTVKPPTPTSAPLAGPHDVAIIGSGFSGIAAATALLKEGVRDFVMFERSEDIGGTWLVNRYPGAEVDLESHIYSFSFEPHDWTRTHADWRELLAYLQGVARKWGLYERTLLGTGVAEVTWDEPSKTWTIEDEAGRSHGPFKAVISAVGFLNTPLVPPFLRGDTVFEGDLCHTSTWRDELTLEGKAVGVLGTGSSAVQVVTEAERQGSSVKVFQIEPNWLLPKGARDFTPSERRWNKLKPVYYFRRYRLYLDYDLRQYRASHARVGGRVNKQRLVAAREYLHREMGSQPDLERLLTPEFSVEARRTVVSDTYYRSLRSPKVELVPHAVADVTPTGVVDATGEKHELDMIVLATGFDAANFISTYRTTGENGVVLRDQWEGGAEAFLGVMTPNFPNFFMIFGPNTSGIPLVTYYEAQARFAAKTAKRLADGRASKITVKSYVHDFYNRRLQRRLDKTVWGEVANYFQGTSGKVISQWPFSPTSYIVGLRLARWFGVDAK
ncbi:flavin-containing monooxygenase [Nocardioides sp. Root190]|uniref:flavin-containing monooxygenase n=1 Tax=Nocardioides sp. Root190 TaxID=1736488 RepID=UPI001910E67B|nr:NAD(P)/FAD-dependent oxidoreductase [Nocardioides sp. Root190]